MLQVQNLVQLFHDRGHSEYGGEAVTQLQHALQCATLAEGEQASSALICAALLHDIGHLIHALPDDAPNQGVDDVHEELGQRYLRRIFGDDVTEPVRLHVAAKRYLCAVDAEYQRQLSEPSLLSLKLQGGPMSSHELAEFRANPWAEAAVRLRRWDDQAKICGLPTPELEHFVPHLQTAAFQKDPTRDSEV